MDTGKAPPHLPSPLPVTRYFDGSFLLEGQPSTRDATGKRVIDTSRSSEALQLAAGDGAAAVVEPRAKRESTEVRQVARLLAVVAMSHCEADVEVLPCATGWWNVEDWGSGGDDGGDGGGNGRGNVRRAGAEMVRKVRRGRRAGEGGDGEDGQHSCGGPGKGNRFALVAEARAPRRSA